MEPAKANIGRQSRGDPVASVGKKRILIENVVLPSKNAIQRITCGRVVLDISAAIHFCHLSIAKCFSILKIGAHGPLEGTWRLRHQTRFLRPGAHPLEFCAVGGHDRWPKARIVYREYGAVIQVQYKSRRVLILGRLSELIRPSDRQSRPRKSGIGYPIEHVRFIEPWRLNECSRDIAITRSREPWICLKR